MNTAGPNTVQMQSASGSMAPAFLTASAIRARVNVVQSVMKEVMSEGQHYYALGVKTVTLANGDEKKEPNYALSKSGAEVLCMTFMLAPEISSQINEDADAIRPWKARRKEWFYGPAGKDFKWIEDSGETTGYYEVISTCRIYGQHGNLLASAQGSANNMEAKYRTQSMWDVRNTLLKMSQKRAFVAAVLLATGASDIFTQDLEDEDAETSTSATRTTRSSSQTQTAETGDYGTILSEAQIKKAKGSADHLKLDYEASRRVIKAISKGDKAPARAFMDVLFKGTEDAQRDAFTKHPAFAAPKDAAPAPEPEKTND